MAIDEKRDTLYFDGACPLCRAEMDKLASHRADGIALVDIHSLDDISNTPDKEALLKRLHMRTAEGQWLIGLRANLRAWQNTPLFWLAKILELPGIFHCTSFCYERWASWRYRRMYGA